MAPIDPAQIAVGIVLSIFVALASFRARFLTKSGASAQAVLGFVVFGLGGLNFAVPILVFFVSSSILSSYPKFPHRALSVPDPRGSTRDAWQVGANGGFGGLSVLANLLFPSELWYLAFVGSFAAAAADTWGTEIGTRYGSHPRLLTTFEPVEAGRSGGITLAGTIAGFAGATLVGLSALAWLADRSSLALACTIVAGTAGSLTDSLFGAALQSRYRCTVCDRVTEQTLHCGTGALKESGVWWINNDVVNLVCTLVGLVAAPLMYKIFS